MGNEAEKNKEDEKEPKPTDEEVKKDELKITFDDDGDGAGEDEPGGEGEGDEEGDGSKKEPDEVQIVSEGDTQPQVPKGFLKRIGKLSGQVSEAQGETQEVQQRLAHIEEENKILKIALDAHKVAPQPIVKPDPDTFDAGTYDPKYLQAVEEYNDKKTEAIVQKAVAKATENSQVSYQQAVQADGLQQKQVSHYTRAAKLKVKDYEETEDKAIAIFGKDNTNHLIAGLPDDSEVALYYFGKNPEQAQKYADMFKTEPIKALIEIGRKLSKLKITPVNKNELPDPDDEIEGGQGPTKKTRGPKGATFT